MRRLLRPVGLLLCILPPVLATLEHFPLWLSDGRTAVSAVAVLLLLLAAVPLVRLVRTHLRSPSAWMLWLVLWVILALFRPILAAVETIALVSFPTSLLGALCFRLARKQGESA